MKKYIVSVTEEIVKTYEVEAESMSDARIIFDISGYLISENTNNYEIEVEEE